MPVTQYIWDMDNDSYLMEADDNGTVSYTNEPGQLGCTTATWCVGEK